MSERFERRMGEVGVARDAATVAGLMRIWCDAHHAERSRDTVRTPTALLGVYGRRTPVLCSECQAHLAYAEQRLVHCPKDPKPFCSHCDIHCYSATEREWQRAMMRYAGPRSIFRGHALEAIRHMFEGWIAGRHTERRRREES
ncbi:MAG: nitrous oxide-stimulated promoter family protein [Coriobacteriia bacterium]|nr:nitrous oxide-stimulated promoter family protein [Coriobacteriia bacterium]